MFEGNWSTIVPVIGVILTGIGVYFAWRSARERQLRLDDVLTWSNEVIRSMQTLYLVCLLGEKNFAAEDAKTIRRQIALDTSVLVEQGRMFFKNFPDPEHGKDKPPAYRGY